MCLYPKIMKNKRYTVTEKNGGNVPLPPVIGYKWVQLGEERKKMPIYDERVLQVQIPCGNCIECRRAKANEWRSRMHEELKVTEYPYFVTLTFDPCKLKDLCEETGLKECNAVAGKAVRRFLERFRKKNKKSLKHWLITELGHQETERIHLHGILFSHIKLETEEIEKLWYYGNIWVGDYCNQKTINYIVKYVTKLDMDHKSFKGQIFCSPGIGKNYMTILNPLKYIYEKGNTKTSYRLENGSQIKLPVYWKNKLYSEEERQKIWRDVMDRNESYVMGVRHSLEDLTQSIQDRAQETNIKLGYGTDGQEWRKQDYNVTIRMVRKRAKAFAQKMAYLRGEDAKNVKINEKMEKKFASMENL